MLYLLTLINVSLFMLSLSLFLPSLSSSPSYMHTAEYVQRLASFLTKCCFSVSQAFDVCLNCCSSPSLGRDHRQHLLICRFRLTPEGPLPVGPPCLLFFLWSLFKNNMLPPFFSLLTIDLLYESKCSCTELQTT